MLEKFGERLKSFQIWEMLKSWLGWKMLKKYRLFFFIAMTFLLEAIILLSIVNEELAVIERIIKNTTQLSILMLVTTFFYFFFAALLDQIKSDSLKEEQENESKNGERKKNDSAGNDSAGGIVTRLLIGSFSASTIPTGVSLVLCAFTDMGYIKHLSGVEIYIAFAGISLISIAVLSTYEEKGRINEELEKVANYHDLSKIHD